MCLTWPKKNSKRNIKVTAQYVNTKDNPADALSRVGKDNGVVGMNPVWVRAICEFLGFAPTMDGMAQQSHRVTERFVSYRPQPGCCGVDFFSLPYSFWESEVVWVNPPWNLLDRTVRYIRDLLSDNSVSRLFIFGHTNLE